MTQSTKRGLDPDRRLARVSAPARVAEPGEAISTEELQLAARNHGMPLEALAYDLTPTGLHYLLTHFDIPIVDPATWRLRVGGLVQRPYELGLDDLRAMDSRTVTVTFECAGNGRARFEPRAQSQPWLQEAVGTAEWTGVPLRDLLERAGPLESAVDVVLTGADHGVERGVEQDYQRGLPVGDAIGGDVLVAYEMNGAPLPPQHGFPARVVVPGWYGMTQVKWLTGIEVVAEPFYGFQHHAYSLRQERDDPGEQLTRIAPRALLVPPGFPDYYSRARVVRPGPVQLQGRAWSGWGPVSRVEVSVDDGLTWTDADLDEPVGGSSYAWRGWRAEWHASPGEHVLTARAHDSTGRSQPVQAAWNRGGFANNSAQRVRVACLP